MTDEQIETLVAMGSVGSSVFDVAEALGVSESTAYRWLNGERDRYLTASQARTLRKAWGKYKHWWR